MTNWYSNKIRLLPADVEFSRYIRERDNWHCVYKFKCFGNIDFRPTPGKLSNSHFKKRGRWNVRFDEENCDAACASCHNFVENHPDGQKTLERWKEKQLGSVRYKKLLIRSEMRGEKDEKKALLYVRALIKQKGSKKRVSDLWPE